MNLHLAENVAGVIIEVSQVKQNFVKNLCSGVEVVLIDLHQLLEKECPEAAEFSIVAEKCLVEQAKQIFDLQIANDQYRDQAQNLQTMMHVMVVHQLKGYDDLLLNQTLANIRTKSLQQKPSSWETWWDKVQIIVQGMLTEAFECRNADEALYQHNLASYAAAYLDHVPSSTDLTQSVVCESTQIPSLDQLNPYDEPHAVGSDQPIDLKGGGLPYVSIPIEYEVMTIAPQIQFVNIQIGPGPEIQFIETTHETEQSQFFQFSLIWRYIACFFDLRMK